MTPQDRAREAGWEQFIRGERTSPKADFLRAIDTFLTTLLEGADERVAEIASHLASRSMALALDTTNDPAYLKNSARRANADCSELGKLVLVLQSELTSARNALEERTEQCAKIADANVGDNGCGCGQCKTGRIIAQEIRALPDPEVKG